MTRVEWEINGMNPDDCCEGDCLCFNKRECAQPHRTLAEWVERGEREDECYHGCCVCS